MQFVIEDLGVQAYGDGCMNCRHAIHPGTGKELAIVSLGRGGFLVIDPRERSGFQVKHDQPLDTSSEAWAIGQAPDGSIYQLVGFNRRAPGILKRWNWEGRVSREVARIPDGNIFTLDIAPDGRVYLPGYSDNTMYRYDPRAGQVESLGDFNQFGNHIRDVACDAGGIVYVTATDYKKTIWVGFNPKTGERFAERGDNRNSFPLAEREDNRNSFPRPSHTYPIVFGDGSRLTGVKGTTFTCVDAVGTASEFEVQIEGSPLRIFSVESGGNKIWGGTFIPLTLFSYEPAVGRTLHYGNPTETNGETYSMVFSENKLFLASYYGAFLDRYTPGQPWNPGKDAAANPRHLGRMKEDGLALQRPHGRAMDREGNVYFAAEGGYGCEDSGLCRVAPRTEQVTRWIYPDTTFDSLCYLASSDQLLVSENRKGEKGIRFTFLSPHTGNTMASDVVIRDQGAITSWLWDGNDLVYGLHAWRATIFAYSLSQAKIVRQLPELRFGEHCHNMLMFGPDNRIWGLTNQCVYAVARDLSRAERVADYEDQACANANRYGMCLGPDGAIYFSNGAHLMRVRSTRT